jgi:hypothetical protein
LQIGQVAYFSCAGGVFLRLQRTMQTITCELLLVACAYLKGLPLPLFTELPRETVRKGARVASGASILLFFSSKTGLLKSVSSTFGASARSILGLFGQFQKGYSRKPVQPRSYWPRSYRSVPPCIGPATTATRRAPKRARSPGPRGCERCNP